MTTIATVGVLGGGLMGSGIAQVAALNGFTTIVREVDEQSAARARTSIEKSLGKAIEKGKLTEEARAATMARLTFTTVVADLAMADIVVEAIIEDLALKNEIWKELNLLCPAHTIFASNTSSLTIAAMAAVSGRGDRMVGLHFFNPVPVMKLVEVVRTVTTSDETFDRAFAFAKALKKEPIAAKDNSGFVGESAAGALSPRRDQRAGARRGKRGGHR